MRKTLLVIFIGFCFISNAFTQSENDSVIYAKGLALLNKAVTPVHFLESASYFETILSENPDHWLASYYTGLSLILAAKNTTPGPNIDKLLDRAQQYVDRALSLKAGEPENHILQAFLYQVRLLADPQSRALNFSQKAEASLKKAMAVDSGNPRAYFLMANNVYYTPPVFRGGAKNALPVFIKAKEKFQSYIPHLSFAPDWGEEQNEEMIKVCSNTKG